MYHFETADAAYILHINEGNFENIAIDLFRYQYEHNELYRQYTDALRITPDRVDKIADIPFLPVSFFKTHTVRTGDWQEPDLIFESSGTTGDTPARHFIKDASLYEASLLRGFRKFYGDPDPYTFLALLPSYLERGNSSLVYMAKVLMARSTEPDCGFYLNEWEKLSATLRKLRKAGQQVILLGVTFALIDFAKASSLLPKDIIVIETGGMKGRAEEWTRDQVHSFLKKQWGLPHIHSEYGMTELLSQAYAQSQGIFSPPETMRVFVREINDPLCTSIAGTGCLNLIDLANVHSCAFLATDDIGTVRQDGTFQVAGRLDHAALRGCSLMVSW